MKIFKIICASLFGVCLFFEVLPFGILIRSANVATYYNYFSIIAWNNGVIGPFFCGIFTIALMGLTVWWVFWKHPKQGWSLTICTLSWLTLILSFMPIMFQAYTTISGIISAILLFCAEATAMIHRREGKK